MVVCLYLTIDFIEPIFSGNGTLSRTQVFELCKHGYEMVVICPDGDIEKDTELKTYINTGKLKIMPVEIKTLKSVDLRFDIDGFEAETKKYHPEIVKIKPNIIFGIDWHTQRAVLDIKNMLNSIQVQTKNENTNLPLCVSQFFRIFSYGEIFTYYFESQQEFEFIQQKEKEMVRQSDLVIVLSSFDKEWTEKVLLANNPTEPRDLIEKCTETVKILYPPVSQKIIDALDASINILKERRVIKPRTEIFKIIAVARLVREKRIHSIIPIITRLRQLSEQSIADGNKASDFKFHFVMIGEALQPEYFKHLKNAIKKNLLDDYVTFTGRVGIDELIAHYLTSDLYIHTSDYEPFGISMIEAASCGCPILVDNHALIGATEVVKERSTVLASEYQNAEETATQLVNFLYEQRSKKKDIESFFQAQTPKLYGLRLRNMIERLINSEKKNLN